MPAGIRCRLHLRRDGFEHERNAISHQHGEERTVVGAEKRHLEAQAIPVERDGPQDITNDEERSDIAELCLVGCWSHWTSTSIAKRPRSASCWMLAHFQSKS